MKKFHQLVFFIELVSHSKHSLIWGKFFSKTLIHQYFFNPKSFKIGLTLIPVLSNLIVFPKISNNKETISFSGFWTSFSPAQCLLLSKNENKESSEYCVKRRFKYLPITSKYTLTSSLPPCPIFALPLSCEAVKNKFRRLKM